MARDLGEQERAFVHALKQDTGRDLAGWMEAIAASGHTRRNDIIDWLRLRGFAFANASWLERIHHNNGQLIYGAELDAGIAERAPEQASGPVARASRSTSDDRIEPDPSRRRSMPAKSAPLAPVSSSVSAAQTPAHLTPASDADIAALLMAAKGLRPLAELVLREMGALVPTLVRAARPPLITIASPMPFAALLPAPKDVRLFADFGPASRDRTRKADAGRLAVPFPDVLVLNDARQIDDRFRELVAAAYTRALT